MLWLLYFTLFRVTLMVVKTLLDCFLLIFPLFNCIQPLLLAYRLANMDIDQGLIHWLIDFLTDRFQKVRVNGVLSGILHRVTSGMCPFTTFILLIHRWLPVSLHMQMTLWIYPCSVMRTVSMSQYWMSSQPGINAPLLLINAPCWTLMFQKQRRQSLTLEGSLPSPPLHWSMTRLGASVQALGNNNWWQPQVWCKYWCCMC